MKPTESYLYPKAVAVDKWYDEQWKLSDHRPLVTTFEISAE